MGLVLPREFQFSHVLAGGMDASSEVVLIYKYYWHTTCQFNK